MKRKPSRQKNSFEENRDTISFEERCMASGELADVPEIDLHGDTQDEAWFKTQDFLVDQSSREIEVVKIVHGIGKGILKEMLIKNLSKHRLVRAFRPSTMPGETGAVIVVLLRG